jgi:hypothetical protein
MLAVPPLLELGIYSTRPRNCYFALATVPALLSLFKAARRDHPLLIGSIRLAKPDGPQ